MLVTQRAAGLWLQQLHPSLGYRMLSCHFKLEFVRPVLSFADVSVKDSRIPMVWRYYCGDLQGERLVHEGLRIGFKKPSLQEASVVMKVELAGLPERQWVYVSALTIQSPHIYLRQLRQGSNHRLFKGIPIVNRFVSLKTSVTVRQPPPPWRWLSEGLRYLCESALKMLRTPPFQNFPIW